MWNRSQIIEAAVLTALRYVEHVHRATGGDIARALDNAGYSPSEAQGARRAAAKRSSGPAGPATEAGLLEYRYCVTPRRRLWCVTARGLQYLETFRYGQARDVGEWVLRGRPGAEGTV